MNTLFSLLFVASLVALIVGLIKPTAFSRFIKGEITRKKIATIFGIAAVASLVLFGITTNKSKNNRVAQQSANESDNSASEPTSSATVSQENAVAKAQTYCEVTGFSRDGLVTQLEFEQFSHDDAVYGADNSGADWNEQAAKKAKEYMAVSAFSRGSLITQLKFDKFTQAQAEYGANAVGL